MLITYWIGPDEHFYKPDETNSSHLHDTQSFNQPPAVAEFQRRWLEANATTASERNGITQQPDEQTSPIAAHEATTNIESMEASPELSSQLTTNEKTFAGLADSERDKQCEDIAITTAP